MMDYGTYRGILTLILMILFVGLVLGVFSKSQKKRYDEAAQSILEDESNDAISQESKNND